MFGLLEMMHSLDHDLWPIGIFCIKKLKKNNALFRPFEETWWFEFYKWCYEILGIAIQQSWPFCQYLKIYEESTIEIWSHNSLGLLNIINASVLDCRTKIVPPMTIVTPLSFIPLILKIFTTTFLSIPNLDFLHDQGKQEESIAWFLPNVL